LVEYCAQIQSGLDSTDYDAVVASGEQVTAGLMALALQKRGLKSKSYMSWQVPIISNTQHGRARIEDIPPEILDAALNDGVIPVVAGFQGVTKDGRITTLGRGGSDTTAVALAAALKANRCDIYTDVDGVYTTDPRIVPQARKLKKVGYEEMLEMASLGAKVLQTRSVELAAKEEVVVMVRSSFDVTQEGTLLVKEEEIMERRLVTGVTYSQNEARITLIDVENVPGVAAKVFAPLAAAEINVDMIVQNVSEDGLKTDMSFTAPKEDLKKAVDALNNTKDLTFRKLISDDKVAKISVVGIGMKSHAGIAQTMFKTLADNGINILVITTSEIKISVLIDEKFKELAVRALHAAYELEKPSGKA
jgi:aspartate kinase